MSFFWVARRMPMSLTFYKFDFQLSYIKQVYQNSVTIAKRNMLLKMPSRGGNGAKKGDMQEYIISKDK